MVNPETYVGDGQFRPCTVSPENVGENGVIVYKVPAGGPEHFVMATGSGSEFRSQLAGLLSTKPKPVVVAALSGVSMDLCEVVMNDIGALNSDHTPSTALHSLDTLSADLLDLAAMASQIRLPR